MTPRVSVVIPTYQRRDDVLRAVESVLAQSFEDFEVIVIDDGSTDGTEEALAGLDPRLRYVWHENRGTGAARNAGLRLARGTFVAFLDSDDRWLSHHLMVLIEVFARFPEAVLVCTCPGQHIAGRQRPEDARLADVLPLLCGDTSIGLPSCVGVDRQAVLAAGGFNEELTTLEDGEMFLRLATRGPFAFVQHRTVVQQITSGSRHELATRNGTLLQDIEAVAQSALDVACETGRPDRANLVSRAEGKGRYAAALRALVEGDSERARRNLEEACSLLPDLSRQPDLVARRIATIAAGGASARLATAATLWPDRRSDTAIFLHLLAAAGAVRSGHPRTAGRFLGGLPLARIPGALIRNRSAMIRLARRAIRIHSSRTYADPVKDQT